MHWALNYGNYGYRVVSAWGNLSFVIEVSLARVIQKTFLYNLEFLQPCHSTFKISDLFSLSIELLVYYTYGQGSFSWLLNECLQNLYPYTRTRVPNAQNTLIAEHYAVSHNHSRANAHSYGAIPVNFSQSGDWVCKMNVAESPVLTSIDSLVNVGQDVGRSLPTSRVCK